MLIIPGELAAEIKKEGEKTYPDECCGIILGVYGDETKEARRIRPIINAGEAAEQYHRFLITPEDMMEAESEALSLKLDILGFYHSHPDHPARPSEYDREHALPFYSYVIVSVMDGKAADFTCWELSEDTREFTQTL